MITDLLAHAALYETVHPRLRPAFAWLRNFSPDCADGRYDLSGDDLYALVQSYDTSAAAERKFEAHRAYADIQYVAAGTEVIECAPLASLSPLGSHNAEKDFTLFANPPASTPVRLEPGQFVVLFPHDAHKPGCTAERPLRIKKVVIKVRLAL